MKKPGSRMALFAVGITLMHACSTRSDDATLVAKGVNVSIEWTEVRAPRALETNGPWSEVLLEVPGLLTKAGVKGKGLVLEDGTTMDLEKRLTTARGEEMPLTDLAVVSLAGRRFLSASSGTLRPKKADHVFTGVRLRASKSLQASRVVWMSYDPSEFKDASAFPPQSVLDD